MLGTAINEKRVGEEVVCCDGVLVGTALRNGTGKRAGSVEGKADCKAKGLLLGMKLGSLERDELGLIVGKAEFTSVGESLIV